MGFKFLGARLWSRGSDASRGGFLLFSRYGLFYGEWEWSQRPEDNGPGSKGRSCIQRVAEKDDTSAAGRALMSAHVLLLLNHESVLVFIEGNGQRSYHC